jgi:hypothetical protein
MRSSEALYSLTCAAALVFSPQITAQQQPSSLQQDKQVVLPARPAWENAPTDETAAKPITLKDKALRQSRSDSFNNKVGLAPRLEDSTRGASGVGGSPDRGYIPPLPVDSPAIVVAKVLSAQSHLSTDHTTVYTELKLQVEQVLKDDAASLTPNGSLDILERGGTVTLSGQTVHAPVANSADLIDVGKRYLLFLYAKPSAQAAFGVTRAWLLNQGHPQPTRAYRPDDAENVGRYMAMSESEFISYVQHAIEQHSTR